MRKDCIFNIWSLRTPKQNSFAILGNSSKVHQPPLQAQTLLINTPESSTIRHIYICLIVLNRRFRNRISNNLRNKEPSVANHFCPTLFKPLPKTAVSKMSSLKHFPLQGPIYYLDADLPDNCQDLYFMEEASNIFFLIISKYFWI